MSTEEIILFFCNHMGVDPSRITSRTRNRNIWHTRYMLFFYMHYNMGLSASHLSRIFNRNRPSVFRGLRVYRTHLRFHKSVREEYNAILKKLEGMAKATPSENMEDKD